MYYEIYIKNQEDNLDNLSSLKDIIEQITSNFQETEILYHAPENNYRIQLQNVSGDKKLNFDTFNLRAKDGNDDPDSIYIEIKEKLDKINEKLK